MTCILPGKVPAVRRSAAGSCGRFVGAAGHTFRSRLVLGQCQSAEGSTVVSHTLAAKTCSSDNL